MDQPSSSLPTERKPKRERTRDQICAAARTVFLTAGYGGATMEKIALEADIGRSTLYTHFRDKDEILGAVADDYFGRLQVVIDALPSPRPTRDEIDRWLGDFADFVLSERVPTLLVIHFSSVIHAPAVIEAFGDNVMRAFAERLPAFADAIQPGNHAAWARATIVLRELSWAFVHHVEEEGGGRAPYLLAAAADLMEKLVEGWS